MGTVRRHRASPAGPTLPDVEAAALGITGTPYGPAVAALDVASQGRLMAALRCAMTGPDGAVVRPTMTAVLDTARVP